MMRVVHTSKSPFEVWLLAALVLAGVAGLVSPRTGSRAVEALPAWGQLAWYGGLVVAGGLALTGALTNRLWSLFVERGALVMLAVLLVAYSAAIVAAAGWVVAFSGVLSVSFAVACVARVRQISVDIRRILRGEGV